MIKLSKMSDHALALSIALASQDESMPSSYWAKTAGLPEATASKLLKQLAKAGLCESQRGKDGGYRWTGNDNGSNATALQVVEAIDGCLSIADCMPNGVGCAKHSTCLVRKPLGTIEAAIRSSLSSISVRDMAKAGGQNVQQ